MLVCWHVHAVGPWSRSESGEVVVPIVAAVSNLVLDPVLLCDGALDLLGEFEIRRGNSTRVVRRKRHGHLRVANVDVGVVIHGICGNGHASDEGDAVGELVECVGFRERVSPPQPTGESA